VAQAAVNVELKGTALVGAIHKKTVPLVT